MNRLARTGDTAEPCGVPRSRTARVPSGSRSGAASHRLTYSSTHFWLVVMLASTALTMRSHGTESNESPPYYRYRGPRRGDPGMGKGLAARRGGRRTADLAPGVAAAGGLP